METVVKDMGFQVVRFMDMSFKWRRFLRSLKMRRLLDMKNRVTN